MASFLPYLSDHRNKDNTHTLWIRVTTYYDVCKVTTELRIEKLHWNPKKKEVRTSHPNYSMLNAAINNVAAKLEKIYTEAKANGTELKAQEVKLIYEEVKNAATAPSADKIDFFRFCDDYFDALEAAGKFNTVRSRRSIIGKFKDFVKKDKIRFEDITPGLLEKYKLHLQGQLGNGKTTVHNNFKRIKEQFTRANRLGVYSGDPFINFKTEKGKAKRERLTKLEIENIETVGLVTGSEKWHARNFWLVSFYCAGIRWGDICTLMWPMMVQGRLRYNMGKTGVFRSLKLHGKAQTILWNYAPDPLRGHAAVAMNGEAYIRKEKSALVFPILPDEWRVILRPYEKQISETGLSVLPPKILYELKHEISLRNSKINQQLKDLAYVADVKKKLSFHTSRHSFADIARKKDISIQKISELLGHSDINTTQQYFGRGFDDDQMDEALDEILN